MHQQVMHQQVMHQQVLTPFGESAEQADRPVVVFAHANGFPPETYRSLLSPLSQHFRVFTVEHRPLWSGEEAPRLLAWEHYAEDLLRTLGESDLGPVWLVGHSMGAITGMLAALKRPELFLGLAALDPVLFPRRFWLMAQVATRLFRTEIPIASTALRRPHQFESFQAAFDFYRQKRVFANFSDAILWDYVRAGHEEQSDAVVLRWSGAWEACVYRSAPAMLGRLRHFSLPMLGVVGDSSNVLTPATLKQWQRSVPQLDLHVLQAGHLVPMERPEQCAGLIRTFIQDDSGSALQSAA